MKKTLLLACTVLAAYTMKAGDLNVTRGGGSSDSKLTVGISVGAGIPMGDFANKTRDTVTADSNKSHGYANTGFHFEVTASYMFAGNIGGMVLIGGNMNSVDAATLTTQSYPNGGGVITAKSFYVGQYLLGPCLSLPAGDKMKVNIHVLVGLVTANFPTYTTTFSGGTDVVQGPGASGFGYNFGAGIKYNFNDKMGLLVDLGYTGSSVTYTGETETLTIGSSSSTSPASGHKATMGIGILTASVGIAFNL